jgi:hypothetical protein
MATTAQIRPAERHEPHDCKRNRHAPPAAPFVTYCGWNRIVEPHSYGLGAGRREVIRAWQVEDCVGFDQRLG